MGKCHSVERDFIHASLVLGLVGTVLTALAHLTVLYKRRHRAVSERSTFTPPISILKPLKGVDDNLYANLLSFVRQDYPQFELLLGVDDANDRAVAVARQLQRDFPQAPVRLVIRRNRVGLNPKVNNLLSLLRQSRFDHVLISDSNVLVSRDYLRETVAPLVNPSVGLVSNVVIGDGEQTLGSLLENFQLNTFVLGGVCLGDWLGHPVVVGKSMLMRRSDLDRLGGLHAVRDVLAEDYVLGSRFHEAGLDVVLSPHPVCTVNQRWDLSRTLSRHGRWAKMRRSLQPAAFAIEPVVCAHLWFVLALLLACSTGDTVRAELAAMGLMFKASLDAFLFASTRAATPTLLIWPLGVLRDLLLVGLWFSACISRTVHWRGNTLRIGRGSSLRPRTTSATPASLEAHAR